MADNEPIYSPLCREITQDGQTVYIEICKHEGNGWILTAIDQFRNQTVWLEQFESDRKALDEVYRTLLEEGISVLVGSPLRLEDYDWPFTPV